MRLLKRILLLALLLSLVGFGIALAVVRVDHVVVPSASEIVDHGWLPPEAAYDILGRRISDDEAGKLLATPEGRRVLSPTNGAVRIDDDLARRGRDDFYRETFGNEDVLTEIVGVIDGALSLPRLALAIATLGAGGTNDLKVSLDRDVTIGERVYRSGETISTGLDVPKGRWLPLGIRIFYDRGRVRVGATCALCHATVDGATGRVVEGAPNTNLNMGLLLALSANPSAYVGLTGHDPLDGAVAASGGVVRTSRGPNVALPDPDSLARNMRAMLASWPPGTFDSTPDQVNNPTSIPSTFTADAHPYGWSGQAAIGPFRGLWSLRNMAHGLQVDPITFAPTAQTALGLDSEHYLALILQLAASPWLRFDPRDGRMPSEVIAAGWPGRVMPGIGRWSMMPSYPRANFISTHGLVSAYPGEPVLPTLDKLASHGLSAFQNRLKPPTPQTIAPEITARGEDVFERAGCAACHSGPAGTSNRVWPASVIGTEPSRAKAYASLERVIAPPQVFAPDTDFPPSADARLVDVPVVDDGQLKLAWALNRTGGGYKVPSLVGLAWTAPYLHDGGVAMGPDPDRKAGLAATSWDGLAPDPANSLRALLDRTWRARVVTANRASLAAQRARATGEGHAFYVDRQAGFTEEDRDALVAHLLARENLDRKPEARR